MVSDSDCLPREGVFSTRCISDKTTTLSLAYFPINTIRISTKSMVFSYCFLFWLRSLQGEALRFHLTRRVLFHRKPLRLKDHEIYVTISFCPLSCWNHGVLRKNRVIPLKKRGFFPKAAPSFVSAWYAMCEWEPAFNKAMGRGLDPLFKIKCTIIQHWCTFWRVWNYVRVEI